MYKIKIAILGYLETNIKDVGKTNIHSEVW